MGFNWRWPAAWLLILVVVSTASHHFGFSPQREDLIDGLAGAALLAFIFATSPVARHNLRRDHQWQGGGPQCTACHPQSENSTAPAA